MTNSHIPAVSGLIRLEACTGRPDDAARVLLVRRARPPYAGLWSLPGGRCEDGEQPLEALIREMREETGLHVEAAHAVHSMTIGAYALTVFQIDEASGHVCAGDDAADIRWWPLDQLPAERMTPGTADLVTSLTSHDRQAAP